MHFELKSSRRDAHAQLDIILAELRAKAGDFVTYEWEACVHSTGPDGKHLSYHFLVKESKWPRLTEVSSPAANYQHTEPDHEQQQATPEEEPHE